MIRARHWCVCLPILLSIACSSDADDTKPGDTSSQAGASGSSSGNPSGAAGAADDLDGAAGADDDDDGAAGAADSDDDDDDIPIGSCIPDDQDGVVGGNNTVKLYITDSGFNVGTQDSGQRNIAVQNSANVTLVISNVGSKPHSFAIACRPTGLPAECNQPTSCFPKGANVSAIEPGDRVTVQFKTPVVEGEYQFTSEEPGDQDLIGEFVLM